MLQKFSPLVSKYLALSIGWGNENMVTKHLTRIVFILIGLLSVLGSTPRVRAQDSAFDTLIQILEEKRLLTEKEVEAIRGTVEQERERLLDKERELTEREEALRQREEELKAKEKAPEVRPEETGVPSEEKGREGAPRGPSEEEEPGKAIPIKVSFKDGLRFTSEEPEQFNLHLGGLLQADYRAFDYDHAEPGKNGFDIRKARLLLEGQFLDRFDYGFQYEFQGVESKNLLDGYVGARLVPELGLRVGQFKEPFSLQHVTSDRNTFFAERSIGYYLTPLRDIGVMAHGSVWGDAINYGVGFFNGDGRDGLTRGEEDALEVTGRVAVKPFAHSPWPLLQNLQVGGSMSHARIDNTNVQINVKTAGLTTFFDVASGSKFGMIRDADTRTRQGAEFGWAFGPFAIQGEYIDLGYEDVMTSAKRFDIDLEDTYVAGLWMITGERPTFERGVFQPIKPRKNFLNGGWGALGLALRYDTFEADEDVYVNLVQEGISVREAEAYTVALNWYLNPYARLILDYTTTEFDRPLLIRRDTLTGETEFSDEEEVITARFQLGF
jgi:phosphate-selective porin OprO/OprP